MAIKLEYILKRNKTDLYTFITKNKLTTYNKLVEYCSIRGFIPCKESEYFEQLPKEKKDEVKKPSRKNSSTQKSGSLGIVIKENKLHKGFWEVMTMGKIEEWHANSIKER